MDREGKPKKSSRPRNITQFKAARRLARGVGSEGMPRKDVEIYRAGRNKIARVTIEVTHVSQEEYQTHIHRPLLLQPLTPQPGRPRQPRIPPGKRRCPRCDGWGWI